MYKALIFDFFDTIAPDFYRVWLERNGYNREGPFLEIAQAIDTGQIDFPEYYQRLAALSGLKAEDIRQEFESGTGINQDVLDLIRRLRGKYKVGLLTNSPQNLVRIILKKEGLEQYFDDIVISAEVGFVKPDPQIFELAIQRLGVAPAETIFVDDLSEYLEGAKQAGLVPVLFRNAAELKTNLKKLGIGV